MYIGIDIGGTSIKGGVVQNGEILKIERVKTPQDKEEFAFAIKNVIQYLLEEYSGQIKGIGIGCPGPLDAAKGVTLKTPNIPQFMDLGKLRKEVSFSIVFNNDANCFALAEAVYGEGKDFSYVLGITLGTGFGTGLVINKKIFSGKGNAVEIAHTIIKKDEEEILGNLRKGSVEQYVGAASLVALAQKYGLEVKDPVEIYQIAALKNTKALEAFKEFGWNLGIAITNCVYAFDPDVIVIGGSMSQAWPYFEEAMRAAMEEYCVQELPQIVRSTLKEPGIVGASLLTKGLIMLRTTGQRPVA